MRIRRGRPGAAFLLPCLLLLAGACLAGAANAADEAASDGGPLEYAYPASPADPPPLDDSVAARLRTPRSAFEFFVDSAEHERFEDAAAVLDLAHSPGEDRPARGPELARKLAFGLDRRVDIDWRTLPDRPDGADDAQEGFVGQAGEPVPGGAPEPRRNVLIGRVDLDDRDAEIRLERVRQEGSVPVWRISSSTVRNIDALYEQHGPGWLDRVAPAWALATFGQAPVWQWLGFVVLSLASWAVGVLIQRSARRLMTASDRRWMRGMAAEIAGPLAVVAGLAILWIASSTLLTLTGVLGRWVTRAIAILSVAAVTWLGMSAINFFSEHVGKQHVDSLARRDEARARRHLTYLSVARRTFIFLVAIVGVGVVLAQFSAFRALGTSLLASAGVAGIVLGIAAQASLANVMAGIQIALTKLIRIGDTVYFEGEWSYVEDITYTFVILRTWDHRRIAVPNKHVVSHPLENWEMTSSHLVMSIVLYVDYSAPVDVLRRKYIELLAASEAWDQEQEPSFQVTAANEDVLEVRGLCSAKDALAAWDLHCRLREELVTFLRSWEDGRYLPRRRVQLQSAEAGGAESN